MPDKKPAKKRKKLPNSRQQALLKNLAKGMTITDAAMAAGYSDKNPGQSGSQALAQIAKTWPDRLDRVVGSPDSVIENYLIPLMNATETKATLSQKTNRWLYSKPMAAWAQRANGLDIYCRIAGAYAPKDPELAAQVGVKVVILDVPRPQRGVVMADVKPSLPSSNGHKSQDA